MPPPPPPSKKIIYSRMQKGWFWMKTHSPFWWNEVRPRKIHLRPRDRAIRVRRSQNLIGWRECNIQNWTFRSYCHRRHAPSIHLFQSVSKLQRIVQKQQCSLLGRFDGVWLGSHNETYLDCISPIVNSEAPCSVNHCVDPLSSEFAFCKLR